MNDTQDCHRQRRFHHLIIKKKSKLPISLAILLLASACAAAPINLFNTPSALDPQGTGAAHIASLWWVMFGFGAAIWALVLGLLLAALLRRRRSSSITTPDSNDVDTGNKWVIRGGIILPLIVLGIVFGYTIYTLAAIENPSEQSTFRIRVIARRWWWEVLYPDQGITTANEIHIPVGVPVQFQLESVDVIHSFWVPQLNGKMDVIPGRTNYLTLQADQAGEYRGMCAEYCGLQHALMGLVVVAQSRSDFDKWVADQQQPAITPTDATLKQGQQVFVSAGCDFCHTIQGFNDKNPSVGTPDLGPDLTHLNSRLTIVGASFTNNTANLAGWVVNAQHMKPGSDMPKMSLSPQDLEYLLAYLQSLK